jgi:hypothetical protein
MSVVTHQPRSERPRAADAGMRAGRLGSINERCARRLALAGLVAAFGVWAAPPAAQAASSQAPSPPGVSIPAAPANSLPRAERTPPAPLPPIEPGCYTYLHVRSPSDRSSKGRWVSTQCLSTVKVLREGPPPTTPPLGVEIPSSAPGPNRGTRGVALNGSYVFDLAVDEGSGTEYDTPVPGNSGGSNQWSVQNNTNDFAGTNGHVDWVQFVFQNFGGSSEAACIWQNDVTIANATNNAQGYTPTGCYALPRPGPGPETIWGAVLPHPPGAILPDFLLLETVTEAGVVQSSIAPDLYGLGKAGNWTAASGGLLGAGGGSEAVFPTGWLEDNVVQVTDCSYFARPCTAGPLPAGTQEFLSGVTGESSNLFPVMYPALTWELSDHAALIHYESASGTGSP